MKEVCTKSYPSAYYLFDMKNNMFISLFYSFVPKFLEELMSLNHEEVCMQD